MTRGLGHDSSHALMSPSKKASPGSGAPFGLARHRRPRQRDLAHVGAGEQRAPDVDRVRRGGHQRRVPGADQHPHEVREALLGPDGRHHLGLGVELDRELAPVEVRDGAAQLGDAPGGRVAVVARVVGGLGQLADGHVGRGQVGVAEAEVDDVPAGSPRRRLEVVDGGEDVGRQPVDPAELHRRSLRPGSRASRRWAARRPRPRRRPAPSTSTGQPNTAQVAPASCRARTISARGGDPVGGGPAQVTSTPSGPDERSATSAGVGVPHVEDRTRRPGLLAASRRAAGDPDRDPGGHQLRGRAPPAGRGAPPRAGRGCRRPGSPAR